MNDDFDQDAAMRFYRQNGCGHLLPNLPKEQGDEKALDEQQTLQEPTEPEYDWLKVHRIKSKFGRS